MKFLEPCDSPLAVTKMEACLLMTSHNCMIFPFQTMVLICHLIISSLKNLHKVAGIQFSKGANKHSEACVSPVGHGLE